MKKFNFLIFFIVAFLFTSCTTIENLITKMGENTAKNEISYVAPVTIVHNFEGTNKIAYTETYKDGKQNGESILYYPNGNVYIKVNYKDGAPDGLWQQFYPNGKIFREYYIKNKKLYGIEKIYYENGKVAEEFNNDINLDKPWKIYFPSGQLFYEVIKNSKDSKTITALYYHENGKKFLVSYFNQKDNPIGQWEYYDKNGKLVIKGDYQKVLNEATATFTSYKEKTYIDTTKLEFQ